MAKTSSIDLLLLVDQFIIIFKFLSNIWADPEFPTKDSGKMKKVSETNDPISTRSSTTGDRTP